MATKTRAKKSLKQTSPRRARSKTAIPEQLEPMEARLVSELPSGTGWQFEPKWDGFRCVVFRSGDRVELQAKSGKPLARFFPEVVERIRSLSPQQFVLDAELTIPIGESSSFDALQMRLHPAASRIRKLSVETPAKLMLFDLLFDASGKDLTGESFETRRSALEKFFGTLKNADGLELTPYTRERRVAQKWLEDAGGALDGVIAKQLDLRYVSGERAMLKVKRMRTADCVVGGFRYGVDSREVASLLLGLYNDAGLLDHVGFTSSIAKKDRPALTAKLEKLRGEPGFTGDAPGAPSRWSTDRSAQWVPLKSKLVVEVCYDHVTGRRFRHGTKLLRWRPDKAPKQCTFEQIEREARPAKLLKMLRRQQGTHA